MTDREIVDRIPTAADAGPPPLGDRSRLLVRRALLMLLVLAVLASCLGWLGPSTRTVSAAGASGSVTMEHTSITRPGIETEVVVTLRPERAPESLVLEVPASALDVLGVERFVPEPVEQRSAGDAVVLEYAVAGPPPYELRLAGRTPSSQVPGRHRWELTWRADGSAATTLAATSWVVP